MESIDSGVPLAFIAIFATLYLTIGLARIRAIKITQGRQGMKIILQAVLCVSAIAWAILTINYFIGYGVSVHLAIYILFCMYTGYLAIELSKIGN